MRPKVRADIALRDGYHSPQIDVDVRLNTNEAPEAPPEGFHDALHAALDEVAWHRYPDRAARELRSRLADRYGLQPDQVFVANGSNEVLQTLLLTYGGVGRKTAVFEPTFAMHGHISRTVGSTVVEGARADDYSLDLDEVARVVEEHEPEVLFLCSPNNPSGIVDPAGTVEAVLEMMEGTGGLLVVDEAYGQFADYSAVDLIDDDKPLVVTRTFSKTWAMAGARLGYVLGPSWLIDELDKTVLPYHLDSFKQAAGIAALDFGAEMDVRVDQIKGERERMIAALGDLPVTVWPSGANFFLFRADDMDGQELWQALVDRSVLVRNCSNWPKIAECLRVTVGTPQDNDRFLDAVKEICPPKSTV